MINEQNYDPVTLEVIRMRLESIVEEMGNAMIRSSGSPVITESGDFNTALFDPTGRIYAYSDFVQIHIGSGSVAVRTLLEAIDVTEVVPGDAFISNDPHTSGASHPPDVTVISPIFYGEELAGWAQSQAHLLDVGGMTAGGFAPAAFDCYSEAVRIPPGVKIFDAGRPVESVRRLLLNNVRVPVLFWNDIRSLVASNNTGGRRFCEALDQFGLQDFRDYAELSFKLAEKVLRDRISKLPDGRWEAEEWTEHNGHTDELLRIHCVLTKKDDSIDLDFRGSAGQASGFVNCSYGATLGGIASAIIPILAWDVPFNEGVMTALSVQTTPGSIVDPVPPAPISNGHLTTGARVTRLTTKLLNEACRDSDDPVLRSRTQGIWPDSWTGGISAGENDNGDYFVLFNMDGGAIGGGAQPESDGLDCSGMVAQPGNTLPDVEMNEMLYPVLYLWKQLSESSGGHGMNRGGLGADFAWVLHGAAGISQTVFAPSAVVPADGFGGGFPGGGSGHEIWRESNAKTLLAGGRYPTTDTLSSSQREVLAINQSGIALDSDDVFVQWCAGGDGYGDPLLRGTARVKTDVVNGFVATDVATSVYGVVFDSKGEVDIALTEECRREIRERRLGRMPSRTVNTTGSGVQACTPERRNQTWHCPACQGELGNETSWRSGLDRRSSPAYEVLAEVGTRIRSYASESESISIRQCFCPSCGTQLDAPVVVEATA